MSIIRRVAGHNQPSPQMRRRSATARVRNGSGARGGSSSDNPGVTVDNSGELGVAMGGMFSVDVSDGGLNLRTGSGLAIDLT